jgi:hypothetical protein
MASRVSQKVAEAVYSGTPASRVSQDVAEAIYSGSPASRVSQIVVEVIYVDSGAGNTIVEPGFATLTLTTFAPTVTVAPVGTATPRSFAVIIG